MHNKEQKIPFGRVWLPQGGTEWIKLMKKLTVLSVFFVQSQQNWKFMSITHCISDKFHPAAEKWLQVTVPPAPSTSRRSQSRPCADSWLLETD